MKLILKAFCFIIFVFLGFSLIAQRFTPVNEIPTGKALVYIYRPSNFVGAITKYLVYANKDLVSMAPLKNNKYLIYFTEPGKYTVNAVNGAMAIDIDIKESGKVYYVRGTCCEFSIPTQEEAQKEIVNCKLSKYKK